MRGLLKDGDFGIGHGRDFCVRKGDKGRYISITQVEDHPIFGRRYKLLGYSDWFEANCFRRIKDDRGIII